MTADLTPQSIALLVHEFYDQVRADPPLAAVFGRSWATTGSRTCNAW